ncbi:MAG: four helix bundle protein [Pirellulaceae bacterium]
MADCSIFAGYPVDFSSHDKVIHHFRTDTNYAEAQSAESRDDFLHKIKIGLKELRETKVWLRLIVKTKLVASLLTLEPLIQENDELISIFVASVRTASSNSAKSPRSNRK